MAHEFFEACLVSIVEETDVVRRFFIRIPDSIPFHFQAGQFIVLHLPIEGKYTNRSYSIASPPSDDQLIELCIALKPEGMATPFIYEHLQPGARIKMSRALGKFCLPGTIEKELCFIGTGTGIAPLRSMLFHIFRAGLAHKKISLIFGNRREKDVLYRREFERLAQEHPEFTFIPVLSRENPDWRGRTGYVHAVYEELFAGRPPVDFFICGWPAMLREARMRLEALGYDRQSIHFEIYN